MSKYENKKGKKSCKGVIAIAVLLVVAIALFAVPQVLYKLSGEDSNSSKSDYLVSGMQGTESVEDTISAESEADVNIEKVDALTFPLLLADGKVEIENVFQFDGINPDCNNQVGNDIAAITVKNLSDAYLASADISMISDDGVTISFAITDLPAGKTTMAFSVDNASTNTDVSYRDAFCEAVFDTDASMNDHAVSVSVDGMHITLENNTNAGIDELIVYCHSALDDQYFGGIVYTYTVNNLPANGTAELDAADCILGLAEVVRIAINE